MAEVYLVVHSASYYMIPALELKDFWAFFVGSMEAAHRARGWVVTSPQRMANLRVHHKTDSNVWFFHLPLCNADILFGSWVSLEEKNVLNYFNEVC